MRGSAAAAGSIAFFLRAPGVVAGLIPWLLAGWGLREPAPYLPTVGVLGAILLAVNSSSAGCTSRFAIPCMSRLSPRSWDRRCCSPGGGC